MNKRNLCSSCVLVLLFGTLSVATAQTPAEDESVDATEALIVLANGELVPDNAEGRRYRLEQNERYRSLLDQALRRRRFGLAFGFLSVAGSVAGWVLGTFQCFGADFDDDCELTAVPWVFALGGIVTAAVSFAFAIGGGSRKRQARRYRVGPVSLNVPFAVQLAQPRIREAL